MLKFLCNRYDAEQLHKKEIADYKKAMEDDDSS